MCGHGLCLCNCFGQVVFSHLCEEGVQVFTEKQLVPAVRTLASQLILSGKFQSRKVLCVLHHIIVFFHSF